MSTRMQDDHGLTVAGPIKSQFRDYLNKKKPTPSFIESMQVLADSGIIEDDVMSYASITLRAVKDEKQFGKLKDSTLDENFAAALRKWTDEDTEPPIYRCVTMRSFLKDRKQLDPVVPFEWLLLCAMMELPPTDVDTVFRAVAGDISDQYVKGREFTWHAPVSTAVKMDAMQNDQFSGKTGEPVTIFVIKLTQKQARDISLYSSYDEGEILLPAACRFRTLSKFVKDKVYFIHLEELFSDEWILDLSRGASKKPTDEPAMRAPTLDMRKVDLQVVPADDACLIHPSETLQMWCDSCQEAVCASCLVSDHKGHDVGPITMKYNQHRQDFVELMQDAVALVDTWTGDHTDVSLVAEIVSSDVAEIESKADVARKDVEAWTASSEADFVAQIKKLEAQIADDADFVAQIKQLESQIAKLKEQRSEEVDKLEAQIANVESQIAKTKDWAGELQKDISNEVSAQSAAINSWSRGVKTGRESAVELMERARKLLSDGDATPGGASATLQAMRTRKEIADLLAQRKGEPVPSAPKPKQAPLSMIFTEKSTPEVKHALSELQQELARSNPRGRHVNAAIKKVQASAGTVFGQESLSKYLESLFSGTPVKDLCILFPSYQIDCSANGVLSGYIPARLDSQKSL